MFAGHGRLRATQHHPRRGQHRQQTGRNRRDRAEGKVEQARFAPLEASRDVLREYNDYFGVPYPLPKLDNIAAPGRSQFFSAMENWARSFTFEYSLLLDPAIANVSDRQALPSTVARARNRAPVVRRPGTMAWWDDLWRTKLRHLDGRPHHASCIGMGHRRRRCRLHQPRRGWAAMPTPPRTRWCSVETVEQASQTFDGITYGKGSAVIGMLGDYVGADAWREGVRSYIRNTPTATRSRRPLAQVDRRRRAGS